jgi:hypothetical protein
VLILTPPGLPILFPLSHFSHSVTSPLLSSPSLLWHTHNLPQSLHLSPPCHIIASLRYYSLWICYALVQNNPNDNPIQHRSHNRHNARKRSVGNKAHKRWAKWEMNIYGCLLLMWVGHISHNHFLVACVRISTNPCSMCIASDMDFFFTRFQY